MYDNITEESPDSLKGSISDDQIISRLWMAKHLKETNIPIDRCVILGSWYGVLPYVLNRDLDIGEMVAVDTEEGCLEVSKKINPTVRHIHRDCNELSYKGADCVINPSVNNIKGTKWFKNIPIGCLVLLQTEDIALEKGCPSDIFGMKQKFPLREYLYEGILHSQDKDGKFKRSMVIGVK